MSMGSDSPLNGSNGFTQKEMLIRIDAKLDAVIAEQTAIKIDLAQHKARDFHSTEANHALQAQVDKLSGDHDALVAKVDINRTTLARYAGMFVAIMVVVNLLVPLILREVFKG